MPSSRSALPPVLENSLCLSMHSGVLTVLLNGEKVHLREKWLVYYALLALKGGEPLSVHEVCDHFPWLKQPAANVGREIWKFVHQQEVRFFGHRMTTSPAARATQLFFLSESISKVEFQPDSLTVAEFLRGLRTHQEKHTALLSECTLQMQNGQMNAVQQKLQPLLTPETGVNDRAHAQVIVCGCLERVYGPPGTLGQVEPLLELLDEPGLSRLNQARVLNALSRHHLLNAEYDAAQRYFHRLRSLVRSDDGIPYCEYHKNYGLYLRRIGKLDQAIEQQKLALEVAHAIQWWYGVQATQYNLALIYSYKGAALEGEARRTYYRRAKEWAGKALTTMSATSQGEDHADLAILLLQICRVLEEFQEAWQWSEVGLQAALRAGNIFDEQWCYEELALLCEAQGNEAQAAAYKAKELALMQVIEDETGRRP